MELITGRTGNTHVTSSQFREILQTMMGNGSYIAKMGEQMEAVQAPDNKIRIGSGMLIHHGAAMIIENGTYDEVSFQNGTQGMLRCDLIVARYEKDAGTGLESASWVVLKGTPDSTELDVPEYNKGNLQEGDLIDDCPMFYVYFNGLNVTKIEKIQKTGQDIQGLMEQDEELKGSYKRFATSDPGMITLPNGAKMVFGILRASEMTSDSSVGGYVKTISLSKYNLTGPLWALASPRYVSGFPQCAVCTVNASELKLSCNTNASTAWIQWMVIG